MKQTIASLAALVLLLALPASAQKVKDFANRAVLESNDLFSVSINAGSGTRHVSFGQMSNELSSAILGQSGFARSLRGRDLFNFWSAVSSNKPVRFLVVGDSVADFNETSRGVRYALDAYMSRGGWGTVFTESRSAGPDSILAFYGSQSGGSYVNSSYAPNSFFAMANAGTVTSVAALGGVNSDKLTFLYGTDPSFGSMLVETQRNGGSWGTRATINAATTAGYTITNFTLAPFTNYNVRFTSTGTNNLITFGLTDSSTSTNLQTWAKLARGGALAIEVLTNAAFWKFYTNYAPQVVFCETKDTVDTTLLAMNWTSANLTNSDVVWITPSPTLPDTGGVTEYQRNAMVAYAQTNNVMLFDKYALFLPTNYWFNAPNVFVDGAHLDYKGIALASSAFADWLGLGQSRFAPAGLSRVSTDFARLSGGNSLSGAQTITGDVTATGNATITGDVTATGNATFYGSASARGPSGQLGLWDQQTDDRLTRIVRRSDSELFALLASDASNQSFLSITSTFGKISIDVPPYWSQTPQFGLYNAFQLYGTNCNLRGTTTLGTSTGPTLRVGTGTPEGAVSAVVGSIWLRTDGSTSTTLYIKTSGTGNTGWTAK